MTDKIAVVTGAGSGLGRVIAHALLDDGYQVALAGRRLEPLNETAAGQIAACPVLTDVADPDSVAALFEKVRAKWGRLDLLVNNAGVPGPAGAADEISVEDWRQAVDINLTGSFLCAQQAVKLMKEQLPRGGRIINNGSISAHSPRPDRIAYTATKHAITGLTKSLSLDGRPYDIACGQIDIGNAATDLLAGMSTVEPTFDPVHVASAVRYMASLPLDANVQFLTLTATTMPYIGRG